MPGCRPSTRISTCNATPSRRRDASVCSRKKKSGKAGTRRPEFEAALSFLRPEDVLVVWKLDRLGRSLVEMMRTIDALGKQGVPL